MAITPLSDIVLDVARAADPLKQREAVAKLLRAGDLPAVAAAGEPVPATPEISWVTFIERAAADRVAPPLLSPMSGAPKGTGAAPDAYRQFEAFVLQSFIESMLPDDAEHVFGKGTAGEIWKSMLAEQLALEIARGGGVGIAKQLAVRGDGAPEIEQQAAQADRS